MSQGKQAMEEIQEALERKLAAMAIDSRDFSCDYLTMAAVQETWTFLVAVLALAWACGAVCWWATCSAAAQHYYSKLKKPNWIPGLPHIWKVWMVAYSVMAISTWLIHAKHKRFTYIALVYLLSTIFSAAWAPSMFVLHELSLGFLSSIVTTGLYFYSTYLFAEDVHAPAYLAIPCFGWSVAMMVASGQLWYHNEMKELMAEMGTSLPGGFGGGGGKKRSGKKVPGPRRKL
eukprot:NODE_6386_length_851_cov_110.203297_g6150_i0.p1 GENE.NODE_6386_length_851_cov_110.203297_g6150_i0~~NODE_6386_length_851_cov_110.203297_g6150_i0.p1  ORF type:complete len:231 (+),score=26.63 NODE_6386_length_851_cov_110.203297_g6150_i0:59-751(+)